MTTVYDVKPEALIKKVAGDLKTKIEAPEWSKFVKTSVAKEKPPENPDWWYVRAASVLRKIYVNGPIGISRLRDEYKSKKNRGVKPEKTYPTGGKIIRESIHQLEKLGLIKKAKDNRGREMTPQGRSYLDNMSKQVS
ncbi:MAG: 30S ribosomal protein S19e [Candidatus Altiarchaeota archaeon]|nr:30S ribosomal protein S19e [Candidatus Altiarchaeota archaeon]